MEFKRDYEGRNYNPNYKNNNWYLRRGGAGWKVLYKDIELEEKPKKQEAVQFIESIKSELLGSFKVEQAKNKIVETFGQKELEKIQQ